MATSEYQRQIKVTLVLNEDEARLIKGLVQNPQCPPEEENPETKRMRQSIWDALIDIRLY